MRRARLLIVPSVALIAAAALAAIVPAVATAKTVREGSSALRKQIDAGQVRAVTVFTDRHIVHASLADKRRFSVRYEPADQRALVASMRAHHVRFHIRNGAKHKAHGLRRRYIVLIAAGALLLLGGLVYAFRRRRRGR